MKHFLVFPVVLALGSVAAAQSNTARQAAAPGCGKVDVKFDIKTDRIQHPFVRPEPGKALIYFLQDDSYYLGVPRPSTRFGLDGNWVGATQSNAYFYVSVDPGEHHLCAEWQSFVGLTRGPKSGASHFTAEAGSAYFFLVRDHFEQNHGSAHMRLSPVDSDEGQLLMSKFGFSTSRAKGK
jgi:hypothetical protein